MKHRWCLYHNDEGIFLTRRYHQYEFPNENWFMLEIYTGSSGSCWSVFRPGLHQTYPTYLESNFLPLYSIIHDHHDQKVTKHEQNLAWRRKKIRSHIRGVCRFILIMILCKFGSLSLFCPHRLLRSSVFYQEFFRRFHIITR